MIALLHTAAMAGGGDQPLCRPGIIKAPQLNGGPTDLAVAEAEACRALCEDHELCGAFTMKSRVHDGCFTPNGYFSDSNSSHANEPPLWPAAQCTLLPPLAAEVKPHPDKTNCSCYGVPRPVCPGGAPRLCEDICPVDKLTDSRVTCGRRRGFTHPLNGVIPSPSAVHCEGLCSAREDCLAWSWTGCGGGATATCWLKNLVGRIEDAVAEPATGKSFSCTGTKKYDAPARDLARNGRSDRLQQLSSRNNFTTYGYLQNPYHRMRHKSGMWRAHDRLNGLTIYPGSSVSKDPLSPNAGATLVMLSRSPTGTVLLTADDFERAGVPRTSPLHTKSRLAMATGSIQATYWQVSENVLAADVQASPPSGGYQYVALHLDTGAGASKGGNGRIGNGVGLFTATVVGGGSTVLISGTGGPSPGAWGLSTLSDCRCHISTSFFASEVEMRAAMDAGSALPPGTPANYTTNSSTLFVVLGFAAATPLKLTAFLARSAPEVCSSSDACPDQAQAVLDNLAIAQHGEAQNQLNRHVIEDNAFWQRMIKFEGAWPEEWQRGLQYDLNSIRANIRPAVGVFKHSW
eukprot:COSAG04_NODE_235_length_19140_cov_47.925109_5_plen_573_part_00